MTSLATEGRTQQAATDDAIAWPLVVTGYAGWKMSACCLVWHKTASPPQTDGSVVFARWRQCSLLWRHIGATWWIRLNLFFHRSIRVHNPNGKSIGLAIFAQLTAVSSGTTGHVLSFSYCPFAWWICAPCNTCFLGLTAPWVHPLLHSSCHQSVVGHVRACPSLSKLPLPMGYLYVRLIPDLVLWVHQLGIQNGIWIDSAQLTEESPTCLFPNIAASNGGSGPNLIHDSMGPSKATNGVSVGSAIFTGLTTVTDRQTTLLGW